MAKTGDRVRFLNATGGGVIKKIEGKTVIVEDEEGFESPVLLKDIVVVLPAGHEAAVKGSNIMFDQKAFDDGRKEISDRKNEVNLQSQGINDDRQSRDTMASEKIEETDHGDSPSLVLAFEPSNIKRLSDTKFTGVLVNDSNYYMDFILLRRSKEDRGWEVIFQGTVNPNELIDVVVLSHEDLPEYGKIAVQGVLYKKEKAFSVMPPLNVVRRLDLTKFHKLHCFRPSRYFDSVVLEYPLVSNGEGIMQNEIDPEKIEESLKGSEKQMLKDLKQKYRRENTPIGAGSHRDDAKNPFKKLPLIEVDLHIGELTDTLAGMEPKDMLGLQLDEVRKTMKTHSRRIGQKIVFIHGKGEGVLRKAVLDLLKKEYPKAELQDASFREYGFGATLVTIH